MHLYLHRRWIWAWSFATVLACGVTLLNNLVYLPGGGTPAFLLEKAAPPEKRRDHREAQANLEATQVAYSMSGWAADLSPAALSQRPTHPTWWLTAFYVHVASASLCLVTGLLLTFPALLRYRRLHHWLGYAYVNAVLWAAAPTGLVLAPLAKGGVLGAVGFSIAAALWWWTTWQGLRAILQNELHRHITAMTRSYALALSAPAFRVIQAALSPTSFSTNTIYVASLWLSLLFSLWLSESWVQSRASQESPALEARRGKLHREIPGALRV